MTTNDYPKETAIGCLKSIKNEFKSSYPGSDFLSETRFGLNNEFSPKLELKFNFYNENPDCPDKSYINLKEEAINSLEIFNESGKNDKLGEKANTMAEDNYGFLRITKSVRKGDSKRKIIIISCAVVGVLVIVYFIICIACRSFAFKCSD